MAANMEAVAKFFWRSSPNRSVEIYDKSGHILPIGSWAWPEVQQERFEVGHNRWQPGPWRVVGEFTMQPPLIAGSAIVVKCERDGQLASFDAVIAIAFADGRCHYSLWGDVELESSVPSPVIVDAPSCG